MILSRKCNKYLLFIGFTLLIVIFLSQIYGKNNFGITKSAALQQFYTSEGTNLAIYFPDGHALDKKTDVFIRVWKQEKKEDEGQEVQGQQEKYYLFLPIGLKESEAYWLKSGNEEIYLNDEVIKDEMPFLLDEGEYELMTAGGQWALLEILYSSDINTLFIETENGLLSNIHQDKEKREKGRYVILEGNGNIQDSGELAGFGGRGNVSWAHTDKKAYKFSLGIEKELLGMPKNKQWVLVSTYYDKSFIRNKVALNLAQEMGLLYTPRCQYVDLYINGEYRGIYLVSEKIEIDEERINIKDLEKEIEDINFLDVDKEVKTVVVDDYMRLKTVKGVEVENTPWDISGGYLLELELEERYKEEISGFITSRGQSVVVKSPEYAPIESVTYLAERYQDFEDAIYSPDGYSPYTNKKYTDYIDKESFAKKYLLEEVVKNLDASTTSQFFYKPSDSVSTKFFAGPAWDYDKALGSPKDVNQEGVSLKVPEGMHAGIQQFESDIWYGLCQQEEFMNCVYDEFENTMQPAVEKIVEDIPQLADTLEKSAMMDYVRWKIVEDGGMEAKKDTYYEEVEFITNFLVKRIQFLQQEWSNE